MLSYFSSSRSSLSGVSVGTGRWCHDMAADTPYVWMDFDLNLIPGFLNHVYPPLALVWCRSSACIGRSWEKLLFR